MTQEQPKPKELDLSSIKYVISDWDGTLVDSMPTYTAAYSKLMKERFEVDEVESRQYYLSTAGTVLTNQIKEGARNFAHQQIEDTLELENQFWSFQIGSKPPEVIEGAEDVLQNLRQLGLTIVVWSGTRTDVLRSAIRDTGLGNYISFAIGNEPGSETKVKGRGLLEDVARNLQVPAAILPGQSIVIGDGVGDIRAGKEINCPTVGILKTQPREKLEAEGADFIVAKISDLPALLKK